MKRDISVADASFSGSFASARMKRSVRDRIGNNADSSLWHGNELSSNKRYVCYSPGITSYCYNIGLAALSIIMRICNISLLYSLFVL